MGYGSYTLPDGRQGGYSVTAVCDEPACDERIDHGLAYLCGTDPRGDGHGCTGYFCARHLFLTSPEVGDLCGRCWDRWRDANPLEAGSRPATGGG